LNLLALFGNVLSVVALRRDRVRPWHAWALLGLDTLVIAVLVGAMGTAGYIGLPFFLLASVAYSLNMPRAARVQLGLALLSYPIARVAGLKYATGGVPLSLVLVETLCLAVIGYLAIAGPIRFTYRVRGARRALGALARGDFSVRLPARALDDLGFLAVSFNDTAEQLGQAVQALEGEIAERTRVEVALRASQEALTHRVYHDSLTGLANRVRFRDRVAAALAHSARMHTAVLAIDLDGFKSVNDTFGHACGDTLLCEIATRLLSATRGSDVVARLGGDEFAVLLRFVRSEAEVVVVAERILRALDLPVLLGDRATVVGASIGIAHTPESTNALIALEPGNSPELERLRVDAVDRLLRDADMALYHAKTVGKGRWARFDPSMDEAAAQRQVLQGDLRLALAQEGLELYYQPIVSLATGHITRLEALLRWNHPTRGAIAPGTFIPIAEEFGLIMALGRWALADACRQLALWQREGRAGTDGDMLSVAVNVSGRQLQHAEFVGEVEQALRESGVLPGSIILELTESAVVHQPDAARKRMIDLKKTGVRLALDDFGTGYSALGYLQRFPIDVLKIDRSFVEEVTTGSVPEALVRTIVLLGKALSLETVAEGIETEEQRRCIEEMGCDLGQGYLFARPMPAAEIERLLPAPQMAPSAA
ncbi:MAG: EAL domain-containing protein, partial [Gemmatimonadaceae bacterium]